ncbi:hypothetical protein ACOME3_000449 [Neoechinorhynchus agilis]
MLNDYMTIPQQPPLTPVSPIPPSLQTSSSSKSPPAATAVAPNVLYARYQSLLDQLVVFPFFRWIMVLVLIIAFFIRMVRVHGFYIVAYVAGIFLLNQLVQFLTPRFLPSAAASTGKSSESTAIPRNLSDEFRPFDRRLKEFDFWLVSIKTCIASLVCTLFPFLDCPVYWPILLMYFCTLFFVTMRQQVYFMIKYRYVPFSYGKARYGTAQNSKKGNIFMS